MPGIKNLVINPNKKYKPNDQIKINGTIDGAKTGTIDLPYTIFLYKPLSIIEADKYTGNVELKNGSFTIEYTVSPLFAPQELWIRIGKIPYKDYETCGRPTFVARFGILLNPKIKAKTGTANIFYYGISQPYTLDSNSGKVLDVDETGDYVRELAQDLVNLGYWVSERPGEREQDPEARGNLLPPTYISGVRKAGRTQRIERKSFWESVDRKDSATIQVADGFFKDYTGFQAWRGSPTSPSVDSDDDFGMGYLSEATGEKTYDQFLAGAVYTFQTEFMEGKGAFFGVKKGVKPTGKLDYITALRIKRLLREEGILPGATPDPPTPGWPYRRAQGVIKKAGVGNDFVQLPPSKAYLHPFKVTKYRKIGKAAILQDNWGRFPIIKVLLDTAHNLYRGDRPNIGPRDGFTAAALAPRGLMSIDDISLMSATGLNGQQMPGHGSHGFGWAADIGRLTQDGDGSILSDIVWGIRFNKEKSLTLALLFLENGLNGILFNCAYVIDGIPDPRGRVAPYHNHSNHYHINMKSRVGAGEPEYSCAGCKLHEWYWARIGKEPPDKLLSFCEYENRYGVGTRNRLRQEQFHLK